MSGPSELLIKTLHGLGDRDVSCDSICLDSTSAKIYLDKTPSPEKFLNLAAIVMQCLLPVDNS